MPQQTSSKQTWPVDEFGARWFVETGDPAQPVLNYLKRRGFVNIVLPRSVYLYGHSAAVVEFEPMDPLAASRLRDCVGVINGRTKWPK